MKKPDLNYFLPIDKFKYFLNCIVIIHFDNTEKLICNINPNKINWEVIDGMNNLEQLELSITVEKIIDLQKFKESKNNYGFIDYEIQIKTIEALDLLK